MCVTCVCLQAGPAAASSVTQQRLAFLLAPPMFPHVCPHRDDCVDQQRSPFIGHRRLHELIPCTNACTRTRHPH